MNSLGAKGKGEGDEALEGDDSACSHEVMAQPDGSRVRGEGVL